MLIHDDILATGGTAEAVVKLVERLGGDIVQLDFLMELHFLNGREKLKGHPVLNATNNRKNYYLKRKITKIGFLFLLIVSAL